VVYFYNNKDKSNNIMMKKKN